MWAVYHYDGRTMLHSTHFCRTEQAVRRSVLKVLLSHTTEIFYRESSRDRIHLAHLIQTVAWRSIFRTNSELRDDFILSVRKVRPGGSHKIDLSL